MDSAGLLEAFAFVRETSVTAQVPGLEYRPAGRKNRKTPGCLELNEGEGEVMRETKRWQPPGSAAQVQRWVAL